MAKNANVLLVQEQYAKGQRKVKEMKATMEGLSAKLVIAESEVEQLVTMMGTLREEKAHVKARLAGVEMEMDLFQVVLQEQKVSRLALEVNFKRRW